MKRIRANEPLMMDCFAKVAMHTPVTAVHGNRQGGSLTFQVKLDQDFVIPAGSTFTVTLDDVYRRA